MLTPIPDIPRPDCAAASRLLPAGRPRGTRPAHPPENPVVARTALCHHPGMLVREMTAADIDAVAELRVRAWQYAYTDLLPRPFLDAMSVEDDADRRRETFAEHARTGTVSHLVTESPEGTVTGWAALGPYRSEGAHTNAGHRASECAELYAIYVHPRLLGTGLGRALMASSLERAAQQGFTRVRLWVLEGNARARRYYERAGFAPDGAADTYDVDGDGTLVPIVRYARRVPFTDSGSA